MRLREWWDEEERTGGGAGDDGGDEGESATLEEARRRGEMLMARAGEAIRKAESGESERFLKAVLQQGGQ
jgi:hypothetical protein